MRTFCGHVVLWCGTALLFGGGVMVAQWFAADVLHWSVPALGAGVAWLAAPLALVPEYWQRLLRMVAEVVPVSGFLLLAGSLLVSVGLSLVNVRFPRRPPRTIRWAMKSAARRSAPQTKVRERTVDRREEAIAARPVSPPGPAAASATAMLPPVKRARQIQIKVVRVPAPAAWEPALMWRQRYLESANDFAAHQAELAEDAQRPEP
jgi:hypothetical protein